MLFKCQAFFNRSRKGRFLQQAVAKLGSPSKKGKPVALTTGEGKVPQPVAKIGCQEVVQQLVAQIPWGRFLHLLNNKPVGISGYVTRLTESLASQRSEKAQGIVTQSRRDRS